MYHLHLEEDFTCQHLDKEYKVMGEDTLDPWLALVCKTCGLMIEEVPVIEEVFSLWDKIPKLQGYMN